MGVADLTIAGHRPTSVVVDRLLRTLLFLPVAGLARTWDLRSYTGTMLAILSGRECAYSQGYTEQFLARLARAKAAERLTETMARWTWSLWQTEQPSPDQNDTPAVFYVDGQTPRRLQCRACSARAGGQARRENPGLSRTGATARCARTSEAFHYASRGSPLDDGVAAPARLP
jgi:hypothetical protein